MTAIERHIKTINIAEHNFIRVRKEFYWYNTIYILELYENLIVQHMREKNKLQYSTGVYAAK